MHAMRSVPPHAPPIIPRVELHLLAVPARDHAEAVVLDLVQPLRLARRLRSGSGKARRDEARRQGTRT